MMEPQKTTTKIVYPVGGYAPGWYSGRCSTCKEEFTGDKRASQCEPCAINTLNSSHQALLLRNCKLESALRKVKEGQEAIDALLGKPSEKAN